MNVDGTPAAPLTPGLYLVATPIGNLRDITLRALDVLRAADLVACEDTRMTGKLLQLLGLPKKKFAIYNDHASDAQRDALLSAIRDGQAVAVVSDAGMPLISDPGYKLVQACHAAGLPVTTLPGANAPLAALQLSGLPSDRFTFVGFLPPKSAARRQTLEKLRAIPVTLIFFESGPRLAASLADMASVFGARPAAVVREITKLYEETRRGSLDELTASYGDAPKGEIVVVVGGAPDGEAVTDTGLVRMLRQAMQEMTMRDAVALVAETTGRARKEIYALALGIGKLS